MAYPDGFTYVSGPYELRRFNVLSTATFKARVPVNLSAARVIQEMPIVSNYITGIAMNDAANSIYGSEILVMVPNEQTVFATITDTGLAASVLSQGFSYNIKKSGNNFRLDTASQATARVTIVPRGDGTTIDSTDSSIFVQFLQTFIYPFASVASTVQ